MTIAENIFNYAEDVMSSSMDQKDSDEIKKRIVDSIFVSYAARNAEPVKIAEKALLPSKGRLNAPLYFMQRKASVDIATFINGSMTRYLDYNDTYLSKEALHPSDNIPPILSYSYARDENGERILKAIKVAYQVVGALSDAVSIRERGWDHVTYISISSASGLAALNGYDKDKFIHTLNLGINNNISLRQTRAGELSMWKGSTAANASRNSVFAAMLAGEGFTGPAPIFEGEMGFFKQVSGEFNIDLNKNYVQKTMIKNFPVEYHAMSAVEASLDLKNKISVDKIEEIDVETFSVAYKIIAKDPEKLRPKTKETADHSIQYIIAYTLLYGAPTPLSYSQKYLNDRKILNLIDKIKISVSQEYDKLYPGYLPIKIHIRTKNETEQSEVLVPKGHFRNPYTWDDLFAKGERIFNNPERTKEIINAGKELEKISAKEFFDVLRNKM